jgi:hypothetical protein
MLKPIRCAAAAHLIIIVFLVSSLAPAAPAWSAWRQLTEDELRLAMPDKATVESEQIETEFRTASGVKDASGRIIVAAALITAGYSAEGKYAHWLSTQATLTVGDLSLPPGEYAVGYSTRDGSSLLVSFYKASTGRLVGGGSARKEPRWGPIRSIALSPAGESKLTVQIGRFTLRLDVAD